MLWRRGIADRAAPTLPAIVGTSMTFTFETTPTGSRMTVVTQFSSVEAMEQVVPGMEDGLRAAMPQLDAVLAERPIAATG